MKTFQSKLSDLFYITDLKRVKADECLYFYSRDQLAKTLDFIEDAIADELNIEWRDK